VPSIILLAILATGLGLGTVLWALAVGPDTTRRRVVTNLQRGFQDATTSTPWAGVENPPGTRFGATARRLAPAGVIRRLDRLYGRAGRPAAWPVERLLVAKIVLPLAALGLTLLMAGEPLLVVLGIAVTVVCHFVPELLLYSRGVERGEQITLELADTLDQMMIAVEAGLGFDSAMARAGKNGKGPLAEELVRTLQDIQLGQSRRQAYESLVRRTDVPDLRRFIRAVIQADAYGIAIADVLRTQASEMRLKRRQRAEEKAMQIPVKVIFPLMVCILPVLFVVLLGPVAMNMIEVFSS
jgi:tight adherence protein C